MIPPRKTSENGDAEGPEIEKSDGIEDAEVVGEDETARSPEEEAPPSGVEEVAPEATVETGMESSEAEPTPPEPSELQEGAGPDETVVEDPSPDERLSDEYRDEPPAEDATDRTDEPSEPRAAPRRSGAGLVAAILVGGVIAALAGVAAARFVFPDGWPGQDDRWAVLAELQAGAEERTARISELEAAVAALGDRMAALPDPAAAAEGLRADLSERIDDVAGSAAQTAERANALEQSLVELDARLAQLAQRPVPEALDPASLDAELTEFRQELSAAVEVARGEILAAQEEAEAIAAAAAEAAAAREQEAAAEAEALRAEAEAAAATTAREAAIARVRAAVESGDPYADALAGLGGINVPEALSAPAGDGVPSLAALVDAFPPAARDALDASIRATMGEGALDRVSAFLRVQTGARSLEPRAGDDPDAVLSRAEAALRAGDLETTLAELTALPEAGQAAMADWIQAARTRFEAVEAARALTPN